MVRIKKILELVERCGGNAQMLKELGRIARKLERIGIRDCNELTAEGQTQKARAKEYKKIEKILEGTSLNYFHQSDPRGYQLYISDEEINQTDYNVKGYSVDNF